MDETEHKNRMCGSKRGYSTKRAAKKDAKKGNKRLRPYPCLYCDKWHLTKNPKRKNIMAYGGSGKKKKGKGGKGRPK